MSTARITMYTTAFCPYCVGAKRVLTEKGLDYDEVRIDQDANARDTMMEKTKRRTVPQIFIGDYHVGGHDDLVALDRSGKLDEILAEQGVSSTMTRC